MEPVRLQKFLSRAGVASRRHAETLIVEGRVRVNGRVVTELGTKVDPTRDTVTVDGVVAQPAAITWIAFHKPPRAVCTRHDPQGRTTIYDLLPDAMRALFTVGRLDAGSEGLLLLTNEGDVANRMLHPRYGIEREYEVHIIGDPGDRVMSALVNGVMLDDGPAQARRAEKLASPMKGTGRLRLVLAEGRNREVRRMFEALGHPVVRLIRLRYGPIRLGRLPVGEWRPLGSHEIRALRSPQDRRSRNRRKGNGWRSGSGES
ncbi:MAG: pseudouridine synthase [Longimicrobiales bacterium]